MKIIQCDQNSPEWFAAKAGIPSASEMHNIITPKGEPSTKYDAYADSVLATEITGEFTEKFSGNKATERGNALEAEAVKFYELQRGVVCKKVGFIVNDEGTLGCSPDRLIGDEGMVEVKCLYQNIQVAALLDKNPERDYYPQMQAQMLVTGYKWDDLLLYGDKMSSRIVRVERNEAYISTMRHLLDRFHRLLNSKRDRLKELGYI